MSVAFSSSSGVKTKNFRMLGVDTFWGLPDFLRESIQRRDHPIEKSKIAIGKAKNTNIPFRLVMSSH